MSIKKQVVVFSIIYHEDEIHSGSAAEAISHRLFNEDGVIEWDFVVKKEESLSADITEEEEDDEYPFDYRKDTTEFLSGEELATKAKESFRARNRNVDKIIEEENE